MPTGHIISALENVSRSYDGGRVLALREVTLSIERGAVVAIVGPSGAGKSTLLHLMCGLDRAERGRVFFDGFEPRSSREWARLRSTRIGFVFQAYNLLPTLTALENVEIPMIGVIGSTQERRRRAAQMLAGVGLANRAKYRPNELSGGERQRVAIARSLVNSPDLILADEPTGNLDVKSSAEILDLLFGIHDTEGTTLAIVSHDRSVVARTGRVVQLLDGQIVSDSVRKGGSVEVH
jgi:putative ABC transport system ATP-binding protein